MCSTDGDSNLVNKSSSEDMNACEHSRALIVWFCVHRSRSKLMCVRVCVCLCWLVAGVPGATLRALGKVEIPDEATLEDLKVQVEIPEGGGEWEKKRR